MRILDSKRQCFFKFCVANFVNLDIGKSWTALGRAIFIMAKNDPKRSRWLAVICLGKYQWILSPTFSNPWNYVQKFQKDGSRSSSPSYHLWICLNYSTRHEIIFLQKSQEVQNSLWLKPELQNSKDVHLRRLFLFSSSSILNRMQ